MAEFTAPGRRGQSHASAYKTLREAIVVGELEPGAVTTQLVLAERFSLGRTPLREALRLLQHEGLLVNEPNRKVQITSLTVADAEQLYVVRILLERDAVLQAVPEFTSRDDAELIGYIAQMDHYGGASDWLGLRVSHRAFHSKLHSGAGLRMADLIAGLADHSDRYWLADMPARERWMRRQSEHRAIAGAAADRDADLTAALLTAHYATTVGVVCRALEPDADLRHIRETLRRLEPSAARALDAATSIREPG